MFCILRWTLVFINLIACKIYFYFLTFFSASTFTHSDFRTEVLCFDGNMTGVFVCSGLGVCGWGGGALSVEPCAPHSPSRQPCQNLLGAIFLGPAARLWHVSERWAAGPKENCQENSFAYITGLSANQSALSKHRNPNRAGSADWWGTHAAGAPLTPPSHTDWLWLVV